LARYGQCLRVQRRRWSTVDTSRQHCTRRAQPASTPRAPVSPCPHTTAEPSRCTPMRRRAAPGHADSPRSRADVLGFWAPGRSPSDAPSMAFWTPPSIRIQLSPHYPLPATSSRRTGWGLRRAGGGPNRRTIARWSRPQAPVCPIIGDRPRPASSVTAVGPASRSPRSTRSPSG
jgi:hypothetical protein